MPTTSVNLTDSLFEWINTKVAAGEYNNASEVFREALRLMKSRDERGELELANLRQKVAAGLAQAERGEFSPRDVRQIIADAKKKCSG